MGIESGVSCRVLSMVSWEPNVWLTQVDVAMGGDGGGVEVTIQQEGSRGSTSLSETMYNTKRPMICKTT